MESPQSPHSSSLWVFALSAIESCPPLHPVPISHLGTKLSSMVLLLFGLRVISLELKSSLSAARTLNLALYADRSVKQFLLQLAPGFVVFTQRSF